MAIRRWKQLAILAKIEAVYGTDVVPTGLANFIQVSDASFTPMAGEDEARNLLQPRLGHQGVYLVGEYGQLQFSVEIAGSGTKDVPPAWGPLIRACGFGEAITEDTDVKYTPLDQATDALSIYCVPDGVRHIFVGTRGDWSMSFVPKRIPRWTFTFKGLLGAISDQANPAVTKTMWKDAVVVSKANTTMSLHGWTAIAESLNIACGNQVVPRHLIGEESIEISDRVMTGAAVVKATSLATVDWFALARPPHTKGELSLVHGTVEGNIVEFTADAIQIGRPSEGQTDNIRNYSLPLMVTSLASNEFTITVR